jgi:hypothetical protein
VTTFAVTTLPFGFEFSGFHDKDGQDFKSMQTNICMDIEATWDSPASSTKEFKVVLLKNSFTSYGEITVPADGTARSWCWSGVPTNTTLHYWFHVTGNFGGDISRVSGSGQVRYP